ncbi:metallophosphoesterase [Vibrio nigripulchritudo]|uniref:metallophosphoesterase n=1 Tax=Vibrio nigripulchritudo TaxID=28173 RepID=UPI0003B18C88|nr:metallophosphoesterase [Vibrio nigripulchritudo]CCN34043.1 putative Metallo-dependent phosphatase [Vibrio nigripulchritudo AM115]CCN41306.1 putative Metallo-dependent phosphatase [Vibrio nigripulchritudo FTn2]
MSIKHLFVLLGVLTLTACDDNKEMLFDYGSEWRYLDTGYAPDSDWNQTDFNDTSWKQGEGIFSYGYDHPADGNTALTDYKTLSFPDKTPSAYYFRKTVKVNNILTLKDVYLKMKIDDAAAIYVNGVEVARSPLLKRDEVLTNTTKPLRYSKYGEEAENIFVLPAKAFVEGENTIAVTVFNQVYHSTNDVQFNASLTDTFQYLGEPDGPYVTLLSDDKVRVETLDKRGHKKRTYYSASKARVIVNLPGELGSFRVNLRDDYTPPAYQYNKPSEYFVTSDLEGNIEALVYMLIQAGIMDEDYNWTYGSGHLYHLGDLFDRGEYVTESLWLFYHLEGQARSMGGDVHFILGNHDLMNFYGDFRYVNARYFENASLMGKTFLELHNKDTVLGQWLRSKNIMEVAGDTLFVHAGFNNDLITALENNTLPLSDINSYGRQHMDAGYIRYDEQGKLIKDAYYLPSRLYWDRSVPRETLSQERQEQGLAAFNAEQVIIGHTVFEKPSYLYNYKVIAADVDHKDNFELEGRVQGLEYVNGAYNHFIADKVSGVSRLPVELLPSTP